MKKATPALGLFIKAGDCGPEAHEKETQSNRNRPDPAWKTTPVASMAMLMAVTAAGFRIGCGGLGGTGNRRAGSGIRFRHLA